MQFPYPGDDPTTIYGLLTNLDDAHREMALYATNVTEAQKQLSGAWSGRMEELAESDLSTMSSSGTELAGKLKTVYDGLESYGTTLITVRMKVDDLNDKWNTLDTQLTGAQEQYGRAERFGEANDMTPADIATYKASIQKNITAIQGQMTDLSTDYKKQVTASNTAATTANGVLKGASSEQSYQNGGPVTLSISDAFAGGLKVNHMIKMQADAKQFEKDSKGINQPGLSPQERQQRIKALVAKYGADAIDPDFATQVATDEGPGYFHTLLTEIGQFDHYAGGSDDVRNADKQLAALNAQILATATNSNNPVHVSDGWIKSFFHSAGGVQPNWVLDGSDYLTLGVNFPTSFLDATGEGALEWEHDHARPPYGMEPSWQQFSIGESGRWMGGTPSFITGSEDDPLVAVMDQFKDHPDSNSVLFTGKDGLSNTYQDGTTRPDGSDSYLYQLTHRHWGSGGVEALAGAVDGETGPYAGDLTKSGAIAASFLHDVTVNQDSGFDSYGVSSGLHDVTGKVVARYMSSVINGMSDSGPGGIPGTGGATLMSGIDGEPNVASIHLDQTDLAHALKFAYSDTGDTPVRKTLSDAWATVSAHNMSSAYATAQYQYTHPGAYPYNPNVVINTAGASSKILGLLTQSDINGFSDEHDRLVEEAAQKKEMLEKLEGLIPIPGLPEGTPEIAEKVLGPAIDAGVDTVKDLINGNVAPGPDGQTPGDHADQTGWSALSKDDGYAKSIITHLSSVGLPIIYQPGDNGGHVLTATVAAGQDPSHLFTTTDGHLKPISQILASGASTSAFDSWYGQVGFTDGNLSGETLHTTFHDPYDEGTQLASK